MLPTSKVRLIQVAKRKLALSDDDYRAILKEWGGADSCTRLTKRGFDAVMDRFAQLGFESDRARDTGVGTRPGRATAAQLDLIWRLWSELHYTPHRHGLDRWIEKHFKVSAARFLTLAQAGMVIGALCKWQERREAGAE